MAGWGSFVGGFGSTYGGGKKKQRDSDSGSKKSSKSDDSDSKPSIRQRFHKALEGFAGEFKRGGVVKRTGMAKVHRGERVLTKRQAKRYRKSVGRKR
jgi:hypothetical protein